LGLAFLNGLESDGISNKLIVGTKRETLAVIMVCEVEGIERSDSGRD
jgi:hypothetical protein